MMFTKDKNKVLIDEFDHLFNELEAYFEKVENCAQAAYHVVCELGQNQYKHSLDNTGYNAARSEMLKLSKQLGDTSRQILKIKQIVEQKKLEDDSA